MEGLQSVGIGYCAKHFPTLANTGNTDFDDKIIEFKMPIEQLHIAERYTPLIAHNLPAIMMSHVVFTGSCSPDTTNPASLSKDWINMLRNDLGFQGLIITDGVGALSLKAFTHSNTIRESMAKATLQAYKAGVDLVLGGAETYQTLRNAVLRCEIPIEQVRASAKRIKAFHERFPTFKPSINQDLKAQLETEAKSLYKDITGQNIQDN